MYVILVNVSEEKDNPVWVDEGYSTTEEDKDRDFENYSEVFGVENVQLMEKQKWDECNQRASEAREDRKKTMKTQDKEYNDALKNDRKRERDEKKKVEEEKNLRPTVEELRKRRLQYFDYQNRRYTRAAKKKLGHK
jgi:hypothetical protein